VSEEPNVAGSFPISSVYDMGLVDTVLRIPDVQVLHEVLDTEGK